MLIVGGVKDYPVARQCHHLSKQRCVHRSPTVISSGDARVKVCSCWSQIHVTVADKINVTRGHLGALPLPSARERPREGRQRLTH